MGMVDGGRFRGDLVRRRRGKLGIGAGLFGKVRHAEHLVAELESGHAVSERRNGP